MPIARWAHRNEPADCASGLRECVTVLGWSLPCQGTETSQQLSGLRINLQSAIMAARLFCCFFTTRGRGDHGVAVDLAGVFSGPAVELLERMHLPRTLARLPLVSAPLYFGQLRQNPLSRPQSICPTAASRRSTENHRSRAQRPGQVHPLQELHGGPEIPPARSTATRDHHARGVVKKQQNNRGRHYSQTEG